jgi:pimeloyl-ACP methyl ester carboxylesterase
MVQYIHVGQCRLAFHQVGNGPPIVFMHGFGLDHRMWLRQQVTLAPTRASVAYDMRGFGFSDPPAPAASYSHTDDLATILAVLGLDRVDLVGHSMGGDQALEFALQCPESVRSLTLVSSGVNGYTATAEWRRRFAFIRRTAQTDGVGAARILWLEHPLFKFTRTIPAANLLLTEIIGYYNGWHWLNDDPCLVPHPPTLNRLSMLRAPTLAIVGRFDSPDTRALHSLIVKNIPNVRSVIVDRAAHMVNLERPRLFHRVLTDFLDSPDGPRA